MNHVGVNIKVLSVAILNILLLILSDHFIIHIPQQKPTTCDSSISVRACVCVTCISNCHTDVVGFWLLVQSYSNTSNRSSGHKQLSTVSGAAAEAQKAGVTSS